MNLDPFSVLLAVLPTATYVVFLSFIRLTGRYRVVTSSRDLAALAVAFSGWIAIGPAQLFFPNNAAAVFGPRVWVAIGLLYLLVVTLATLMVRPSLVVYGRTPEEIYAPLLRACHRIDESTIGDATTMEVHLKTIGLRLRCDGIATHDATRIASFSPAYGPSFWHRLIQELHAEGIDRSDRRRVGGAWPLVISIAAIVMAIGYAVSSPLEVVAEFRRWLLR